MFSHENRLFPDAFHSPFMPPHANDEHEPRRWSASGTGVVLDAIVGTFLHFL